MNKLFLDTGYLIAAAGMPKVLRSEVFYWEAVQSNWSKLISLFFMRDGSTLSDIQINRIPSLIASLLS